MGIFNNSFMPHGHCYFWRPDILWLHVISDALIALAYFVIPILLFIFIKRKKDTPYKILFVLFGIFVFSCGITHVISIFTVWNPIYVIEGWSKSWTAFVSVLTGVVLIPTIPKLLSLKSPTELEEINDKLLKEIEEHKKTEENLRNTISELEQYAYTISHDLREPVKTMANFSELLHKKYSGKIDENADRYIDFIKNNSSRMYYLISDLLDYSRAGKHSKAPSDFSLNTSVENITKLLGKQIEESSCEILVDNLPVVEIHESDINSIFQNLISNAIKYRKKDTNPLIKITSEEKEDKHIISVSDNGIGINKDYHDKVFELFEKLNDSDDSNSTGIGLAICKKIVSKYGGDIWIESKNKQGTTFFFSLPKH